jgi:hypothetical protein
MRRLLWFCVLFCGSAFAQVIHDPIADFLELAVPDRYSDASEVVDINKVSCDLNGDGSDEVFVGHHKMWTGDNRSIYYAAYQRIDNGFRRLLAPDQDLAINFHGGNRTTTFVGFVQERSDQGLLIVDPVYRHKADDPRGNTSSRRIFGANLLPCQRQQTHG